MTNYKHKLYRMILSTMRKKELLKKPRTLCEQGKHSWTNIKKSDYRCKRNGCKQHKFDMGFGAYLYTKKEPFVHPSQEEAEALEQIKQFAVR